MSIESAREREVKLGADLNFTVPDLRDLLSGTLRLPQENLWATYFDTSDLRLWRRGITLRHRSGERAGTGTWTIKLPNVGGSGPVLDRQELTWPGSLHAMPDAAIQVLQGIVRHSNLQEVACIETVRRRLTLKGHADSTLGELDDDTVTIHGGTNDGLRFRQIELEFEEEDADLIKRVLDRLHAAGARPDQIGPKLARALDDSRIASEHPDSVRSRARVGEVVQAGIASALDRILENEFLLRVDAVGPPAHNVHQTRVASRRLRSDLKTFRDVLDPVWVGRTRRDLKWIGSVLGLVRDIDVLAAELTKERGDGVVDLQGFAQLSAALREQRRSAARGLAEALDSDRYILLLDKLHAASQRPPLVWTSSSSKRIGGKQDSKALARLVRRPWKKIRRKVKKAGKRPSDRQLHRIRIRAKQLRYACEASSAVLGGPARKMAKAAEGLQTELGIHHDAVDAEKWLRTEAARSSRAVAFSAGQLATEQRLRQRAARQRWRAEWKRVNRRSHSLVR